MNLKRLSLLLIVLIISCGIVFADDNSTIDVNGTQTADNETDDDIDDSNETEDDNETEEYMDEDYETLINNNIGIQEDDFDNSDVAEGNQSNATASQSNDNSPITHGAAEATGNPILLLILAMGIIGFNQIYKRD